MERGDCRRPGHSLLPGCGPAPAALPAWCSSLSPGDVIRECSVGPGFLESAKEGEEELTSSEEDAASYYEGSFDLFEPGEGRGEELMDLSSVTAEPLQRSRRTAGGSSGNRSSPAWRRPWAS